MKRMTLAAVFVLGLVAAACGNSNDSSSGDSASQDGGGAQATSVSVDLKDFTITPSVSSAPAGSVTFDATNSGPSEHEMVLVKTDLAPDALPVKDGGADEEGAGVKMIGEIEEFEAGGQESATFDLEAGAYVLLCNIPGHYLKGMAVAFTVE